MWSQLHVTVLSKSSGVNVFLTALSFMITLKHMTTTSWAETNSKSCTSAVLLWITVLSLKCLKWNLKKYVGIKNESK